jgi:hypothetical protein
VRRGARFPVVLLTSRAGVVSFCFALDWATIVTRSVTKQPSKTVVV